MTLEVKPLSYSKDVLLPALASNLSTNTSNVDVEMPILEIQFDIVDVKIRWNKTIVIKMIVTHERNNKVRKVHKLQ